MSKLAIAGKGGSGKTTLAGILARVISQRGYPVWAVDADNNPNLGLTLGLPKDEAEQIQPLPRSILKQTTDEAGEHRLTLAASPLDIARQFGTRVPDGITLLLMGTVDHAGQG